VTPNPIIHDLPSTAVPEQPGRSTKRPRRVSISSLTLAVGCAIAIAACGSSSGSKAGSGTSFVAVAREYAQCMRAHGQPSFPDPTAQGTFTLNGSNINPHSPVYKAAQQECKNQRAAVLGASPYKRKTSESQKLRDLKFAKCMRAHGITDYPDPTYIATPDGGSELAPVPSSINQQSPTFITAEKTCQAG
jgi:hypothetical protein